MPNLSDKQEQDAGRNVPKLRFPEFSGEWERQSLGEVGEPFIGLTYGPSDVVSEGGVIVFRSSNIQNGEIDYSDIVRVNKKLKENIITRKDDLLICARNGSPRLIGKNALLKERDANQTFGAFMLVYRSQDNHFIHQLLSTKKYYSQVGENLGARINQITTANIKDFEFFFPKSEDERDKISKFLDLIDRRIAIQNRVIELYESLIKAITDRWILELLKGTTIRFERLYVRAGEGGTPSTSERAYYEGGEIPFIKIDDLSSMYLTENKDYITSVGLAKSSAWIIPKNSLIYSNGATIGSVCINTYPVATKQGILGIVPKEGIKTEYLYYLMRSSYFSKEVQRIITEGTMKTAYLKDINRIICPIPSPEQQACMVSGLLYISEKSSVEKHILSLYTNLKKTLLARLFI